MALLFTVGSTEQHVVEFYFNKFLGNLRISVDGEPIVRDFRLFSISLKKDYHFIVGVEEQHSVIIRKIRRAAFAGYRPQEVYAYVDGEEIARGSI